MIIGRKFIILAAAAVLSIAVLSGCAGNQPPMEEEQPEDDYSPGAFMQDMPVFPDVSEYGTEYLENLIQFRSPDSGAPIAVMQTSMGEIRMVLYPQFAPRAVENFITHANDGYFDGMIFHRVINDFMIQSGDPSGTGTGGESVFGDPFEDELTSRLINVRGAVSMANPGIPNHNQSQFFIVQNQRYEIPVEILLQSGYGPNESDQFLADILTLSGVSRDVISAYIHEGGAPHLDGRHTVFGMVIDGMDVVDAIAAVETNEDDRPLEEVTIDSVTIEMAA